MGKLDDDTRRWAEIALNEATNKYDALIAHAEEYESAAADIRGEAAHLAERIEDIAGMLDQ